MRGARFIACAGVLSVLSVVLTPHPGFPQQKGDPKAGKQRYDLLCSSCHGATGKGDGPASAALTPKPQNHADGKHMNALTDKYLFDIIKGGGASVGKSPLMPPWGTQLKDQDIRNVVAYIRTLAVPPYKPAQ
jgi:mono/diheme cytochrome c family protein